MTRSKKFIKLGNAIRRYRGVSQGMRDDKVVWKTAPQKEAVTDIVKWFNELGIPHSEIVAIRNFKSFDDLRTWMTAQQEVTV